MKPVTRNQYKILTSCINKFVTDDKIYHSIGRDYNTLGNLAKIGALEKRISEQPSSSYAWMNPYEYRTKFLGYWLIFMYKKFSSKNKPTKKHPKITI